MKANLPVITLGKVFNPRLPNQLNQSEPPIKLAEVILEPNKCMSTCALLEYSQFITFTIFGLNPKLEIVYRLIRQNKKSTEILQIWDFLFESATIAEVANIQTNQPDVFKFCDCDLQNQGEKLIYLYQIISIKKNSVREFELTNKNVTGNELRNGKSYLLYN
ncbi:hypothetical protein LC087_17345 [Bacillus carboniphilus]|uniref:Uncharacterized protein n=1 Tax=Bacillus carboniphilus TaxID=86663 RepID=A0ABY9JUM9_9BACI|nr:hypothetical protein [Bacillus carboniphilus]WLR42443.1 hypothetical protein LC087_17345 [Bacillus carboniphilus]